MNIDRIEPNFELVEFDNLTKSSRVSHDSENNTNVLFQLYKPQHSFPRNNDQFISIHLAESNQNMDN
ncbi:unnamed protein product [Schistosoma turkestanicum]|nr:unnamed protein product [Schistosoma turkestanicum]